MQLTRTFFSLALAATLFSTSACKTETGCTDQSATNFDYIAEEDDGSCNYQGSATLWWTSNTAQNQVDAGNTEMEFYVDGVYAGSGSVYTGWSAEPLCGHTIAINVEKDLGSAVSGNYSYSVKNDQGQQIHTGTFLINGNECTLVRVDF